MRILFWCGDYYPNLGGALSVTDDLARQLLRQDHQVTVLTRLEPGLQESETYHGYRILRFPFPLPYDKLFVNRQVIARSPRFFWRLGNLLRRYDVVCIGLLDVNAAYLLALHRVLPFRLVLYLHGGDTRKLPATESRYRRVLQAALWSADAVIPVSEDLGREACAFLPSVARKLRVIPNGIDTEIVQQISPWPHPRQYLAFVGRLVEEKQVEVLIDAFAQARIPDVDLLLVGTGVERERLQSKGASGRIHFLGRLERDQALAVIRGSLFVVLPSRTEGYPIVAIEALAAGKPVIGSNIRAVSQIVGDGVTGALFPVGDAAALARLFERYVHDRAALAGLTSNVESLPLHRWSMASLVHRHVDVYSERRS